MSDASIHISILGDHKTIDIADGAIQSCGQVLKFRKCDDPNCNIDYDYLNEIFTHNDVIVLNFNPDDSVHIPVLLDFLQHSQEENTILIFEKNLESRIVDRISNIQKSCIFPVQGLNQSALLETIGFAFEQNKYLVNLRQDIRLRQSAIGLIRSGVFELRTPIEARNLATMLGLLCRNSELVGIGVFELIMNAIEHGNLEIGSNLKQSLIKQSKLSDEITARLSCSEYETRKVVVKFDERDDHHVFEIQDEGNGFAIEEYWHFDKTSFCGRGIYIAKSLCFDDLQYRNDGTCAVAIINKAK
ncbi:MAG: hypothetical protein AAF228_08930 [Pseudomonadota bacterium]